MATRFLDTGEARLSPLEKSFLRSLPVNHHIHRPQTFHVPPAVTGACWALAIGVLTIAAFAV